jgi:transcriptional regulator with XRE-family HTH domain
MTFASYIRQTRVRLGLTQARLALRLGCSIQAVSNWECGRSEPWPDVQNKIIASLNERGVSQPAPRRSLIVDRI